MASVKTSKVNPKYQRKYRVRSWVAIGCAVLNQMLELGERWPKSYAIALDPGRGRRGAIRGRFVQQCPGVGLDDRAIGLRGDRVHSHQPVELRTHLRE
jgi:hypothetical protein